MLRQGSGVNEGFWTVVTVRKVQGHVLSEIPDNGYILYLCNRIWNNKGKTRTSNQFYDHDIYSRQRSYLVTYWVVWFISHQAKVSQKYQVHLLIIWCL